MFKKLLAVALSLSLVTVFINFSSVQAESKTSGQEFNGSSCGVMTEEPVLDKDYVNEKGEQVQHFKDNTQVIYHSDGTITVYSPFGPKPEDGDKQARIGWIAIGKAILKIAAGVISACQAVVYVTGHDVCRIVLRYITHPKKKEYTVKGQYHSGYIPGCQPQHSGPCNAGYWEYRVS